MLLVGFVLLLYLLGSGEDGRTQIGKQGIIIIEFFVFGWFSVDANFLQPNKQRFGNEHNGN
jgi:hypothetical protein